MKNEALKAEQLPTIRKSVPFNSCYTTTSDLDIEFDTIPSRPHPLLYKAGLLRDTFFGIPTAHFVSLSDTARALFCALTSRLRQKQSHWHGRDILHSGAGRCRRKPCCVPDLLVLSRSVVSRFLTSSFARVPLSCFLLGGNYERALRVAPQSSSSAGVSRRTCTMIHVTK